MTARLWRLWHRMAGWIAGPPPPEPMMEAWSGPYYHDPSKGTDPGPGPWEDGGSWPTK